MTTIVQSADGSGTISLVDNSNSYILTAGTTHNGRIDLIDTANSNTSIVIAGDLIGAGNIAFFDAVNARVTFTVTAKGSVIAMNTFNAAGMSFRGDDATLNNAGTIMVDNMSFAAQNFDLTNSGLISEVSIVDSSFDQLILLSGATGVITNSGTMTAEADIVDVISGSGPIDIFNSGKMIAGQIGISTPFAINIQNSGLISGKVHAIEADEDLVLLNSGDITALDTAVEFGVNGDIQNTGSIISDMAGLDGGNDSTVVNGGTITAGTDAVALGDNSSLRNDGDIRGGVNAVTMGDNADVINTGTLNGFESVVVSTGMVRVQNTGEMTTQSTALPGAVIEAVGNVTLNNSGSIVSGGNLIQSTATASDGIRVVNEGQIEVRSAIISAGTAQIVFSNSGDISAFNLVNTTGRLALSNRGDMNFDGFFATAGSYSIQNTGTIIVAGDGLTSTAGVLNLFNNQGILSAEGTALTEGGSFARILNSGAIIGSTALELTGSGTSISNSGEIRSLANAFSVDPVAGILMSDTAGQIIHNSGTIFGLTNGIDGSTATGSHRINNSGLIDAQGAWGVFLSNQGASDFYGHTLVNSGQINAGVSLSEGDDIYRGIGDGFVDGLIDLGDGNNMAWGGDLSDIFIGGSGIDEIRGGGGDDDITGGAGNDVLFGKLGDDVLDGGDGDDKLMGDQGDDTLSGGFGEDLLVGGAGDDILNGGANNDELRGGDGQDLLQGLGGDDDLFGGFGNDILEGGGGNDGLRGGAGDDFLWGANGDDRIEGGAGIDTVQYTGDASNFTFELLSSGNIRVTDNVGNNGVDILSDVELVKFVGGGDPVDIMDLI